MSNQNNPVIVRFQNVSLAFNEGKKIILDDVDFSIRERTKISLMGQNGAGKSTIFKMLIGEQQPDAGRVLINQDCRIAIARQVIPRDWLWLTVREYFSRAFSEKDFALDKKIGKVLDQVNLTTDLDRVLKEHSGWQQARLLLAFALIQEPDILLLDEPTNNLDRQGIGDLIAFLMTYEKTVIVISHDADFLNMFTDGVLYLNVQRKKVEQYRGDYYDVLDQIQRQIEKEEMQNARMEKQIRDAKEKINYFSNKWGKMRKIASKMRDEIAEAEENLVDVRKDDKTIRPFEIPFENFVWPIVTINTISLLLNGTPREKHLGLELRKKHKVMLHGPNGIGKSTLLKRLVNAHDADAMIHEGVRVGYYSQDFSALDLDMVVWDALHEMSNEVTDQEVYKIASWFLLQGDVLKNPIYVMSEWQKALLCYARFVIQKPHLLILDEPTNHVNFRHLPIIAQAINAYEGAVIVVCHDEWFVRALQGFEHIDVMKI